MSIMVKYSIIGSFVFGRQTFSGQSIKTRSFADTLEAAVAPDKIQRIDTRGWKRHPLSLIRKIGKALGESEEIVILPAHRGVRVIPRLLIALRGRRTCRLRYVVIGGWLHEDLNKHPRLKETLKRFDGIYVETESMKRELERDGFQNIIVLPNFKNIQVLSPSELVYTDREPFRLCTFSRVLREKGVGDAVEAVEKANHALGRIAFELDIYGQVDSSPEQSAWFEGLRKTFPPYVRYMGAVDGARSTTVIRDYFALLFPTYYLGEGYPGTLLDAFSAGVPAIASDWRYNAEIIGEDKGLVFPAHDAEALSQVLVRVAKDPELLNRKKPACLAYANRLKPEELIKLFLES